MHLVQTLDSIISYAQTHDTDVSCYQDAYTILSELKSTSPTVEMAYARYIRECAKDCMLRVWKDVKKAETLSRAIDAIQMLNADIDFDSYMLALEYMREPEKRFYQPRRGVLYPLVSDLQDLCDDRIDFLSISLPPRVGKSTMCIFYLTFLMGKNPLSANVMSGHSDKLTKGFYMEALSIITDASQYRFGEIFPSSYLADNSAADETIALNKKLRFPTLTCRSIEGTLTGAVEIGRTGILYCDDLVSDREEALNSDRMDKLYSAYLNQLRDRKLDGAKELHVGTRWTPEDVIGRIEQEHEHDPRYRFSKLPALNADGKSNFTYQYNLGFSTEYYVDMRQALVNAGEDDSWSAKYMCAPYWISGRMFEEEELKFYDELPEGDPDLVVAACDTKDRGKDFACLVIDKIYGENHYIDAVVCDNSLPEVVEPKIVKCLIDNEVTHARFESNSAGGRVADDIEKAVKEAGHNIVIRKKYSTENKETRILSDSLWIKERCYFKSIPSDNDYRTFMNMLTSYSTEGKNKHDDAPDAMSMLKRYVTTITRAKVVAMRRLV